MSYQPRHAAPDTIAAEICDDLAPSLAIDLGRLLSRDLDAWIAGTSPDFSATAWMGQAAAVLRELTQ
jgi:hypothetical protein